jgi:hypothetical protein
MTAPEIKLDVAVIARNALLYNESGSIACGLITGGVAVAGGMPAVLSAASAPGGGLVRLLGNLAESGGTKDLRRTVAADFMAWEG